VAAEVWMDATDLSVASAESVDELTDAKAFEFLALVRMLEARAPFDPPIGEAFDPSAESVRFSVVPRLAFPAGEVASANVTSGRTTVAVHLPGLTGPLGVLPRHYTELVRDRRAQRDHALGDFLDLFHHRMLALFYRGWSRHRPGGRASNGDTLARHLLDIVGLGTDGLCDALPLDADVIRSRAGLLGPTQRSAVALEQLLEDAFDVPVNVQQFVGRWYAIADTQRTALDDSAEGEMGGLSLGAMVGDAVWDAEGAITIRIGPLTRAQYDRFLPGGADHTALQALVKLQTDDRVSADAVLILRDHDVPGTRLTDPAGRLGYGTWLRARDAVQDAEDTVIAL
jgi:type VI secretion system protein ImpH